MTIVASVKARDGIVLATDSMSQITAPSEDGQMRVVKSYGNARKLFQVKDLPIGVMSYSLGNIGARSIESLVLEFSRDLTKHARPPYSVEAISRGMYQFVKEVYDATLKEVPVEERQKHLRLGFFIGGYSPGKLLPHQWECELSGTMDVKEVRTEDNFGSSWRGIIVPFERLYNGFDRSIIGALEGAGVAEGILQQVFTPARWRMPIAYDGMPVQDAINFVVYILRTTIGAATFEATPASTCGGPLQIAVVLPDTGWQWIRYPELAV